MGKRRPVDDDCPEGSTEQECKKKRRSNDDNACPKGSTQQGSTKPQRMRKRQKINGTVHDDDASCKKRRQACEVGEDNPDSTECNKCLGDTTRKKGETIDSQDDYSKEVDNPDLDTHNDEENYHKMRTQEESLLQKLECLEGMPFKVHYD